MDKPGITKAQPASPASRERKVHERYEWVHILNDFLISLYFLVGSVMFFYPTLEKAGTWLFVIGSAQMLVGPVIRTLNKLHIKTIRKDVIHW